MTNHRNEQNYRFTTWTFRARCHLKGGVPQGCFLNLILNYLIQYIHFHSLYIMNHYYAKFKENPCVGTDASTPFRIKLQYANNVHRKRSGSVVECLTWDRGVVGSSLTGVTALCPCARHIYPCLVLVQPRKTRPNIIERLLTGTYRIKSNKQTKQLANSK